MKEQEVRKILEAVTDERVRGEADMRPEMEQRLEARRHFEALGDLEARSPGTPVLLWVGLTAVLVVALLAVGLLLLRG